MNVDTGVQWALGEGIKNLERILGRDGHVRVAFGALDVECFFCAVQLLAAYACVELGIGMHLHRG